VPIVWLHRASFSDWTTFSTSGALLFQEIGGMHHNSRPGGSGYARTFWAEMLSDLQVPGGLIESLAHEMVIETSELALDSANVGPELSEHFVNGETKETFGTAKHPSKQFLLVVEHGSSIMARAA